MTAVQHTLDVQDVPIELIDPNPANIRTDLGDLSDLVESIRRIGVQQPGLGYRNGDRYTLIYAHRRLAASKLAGLETFPLSIRDEPDEATMLEMMLDENVQRSGLDPIDEGLALVRLKTAGRYRSHQKLGEAVHRSKDWVQRRITLVTKLPEPAWQKVRDGDVSIEDAAVVAAMRIDDKAKQKLIKDVAAGNTWQVQQAKDKAARAAKVKKLRDEHGTVLEWPPRQGKEHPWGIAELGDKPGQLNLPAGLHTGCPGHAVVHQEWAKRLTAFCLEPLTHAADQFVDAPSDAPAPAVTADGMWPLSTIGLEQYLEARGHAARCPGHQVLEFPWGTVSVCSDPEIHTDESRTDYLPAEVLAKSGHGGASAREIWVMPADASELLAQRVTEGLATVPNAVRMLLRRAVDNRFYYGSEDDVPETFEQFVVPKIIDDLEGIADDPACLGDTGHDPFTLEGVLWGLQACIDVGAPPPTLDAIRTRIEVLSKGETTDTDGGDDA